MTRRLLTLLAALAVVLLPVSACGAAKKTDKPAPERLASAQKYLADAQGVTIALSTPKLPQGVQGIVSADGLGTKAPAFKGEITVVTNGLSVNVPVVAVDGKVYIKFGGAWQDIDPGKFHAPDPASLFRADGGLATLLSDVKGAKAGQDTREGKRVLSTISGTIPGKQVASIIPTASATSDFKATFVLDDRDHLVSTRISGPFYPDASDVSYTIGFSKYGTTADITAP